MSYSSCNYLPKGIKRGQLLKLVELLGFERRCHESDDAYDSFMWHGDGKNEISFVGVELYPHKDEDDAFRVDTRTRSGRSYWDLQKQNEVIKAIHDYLGGRFSTDEGKTKRTRREHEQVAISALCPSMGISKRHDSLQAA